MANFNFPGGERPRDELERFDYLRGGSSGWMWIVLGAVIVVFIGLALYSLDGGAPTSPSANAPMEQTAPGTAGAPAAAPAAPTAPAK